MTRDENLDHQPKTQATQSLDAARPPFPNISGQWKMEISWQRSDEHGNADARAVIKQVGSEISMEVFSRDSDSRMILAQPGRGDLGSPVLHYMFQVEPKYSESDAGSAYKGAAILHFDEYTGELRGNYWTSQFSRGHYRLVRESGGSMSTTNIEAVDVVLITALKEEYDAAKEAFSGPSDAGGVREWVDVQTDRAATYIVGTFILNERPLFTVAIARPTRMGANSTGPIATLLVERLKPKCLVMCGVCAGNPGVVGLGDVIVSELAYQYDEGKRDKYAFWPDPRHTRISTAWHHAAQSLTPNSLPSYGKPEQSEQRRWLLKQIYHEIDPLKHPARARYFPDGEWAATIKELNQSGLIEIVEGELHLTKEGVAEVRNSLLLDVEPPKRLPFSIETGPIASGNAVVKDETTWETLKAWGPRSVIGIEMEAASIGEVARRADIEWIVIKGVMDHGNSRKDDRYKSFAARASAETLRLFLMTHFEMAIEGNAIGSSKPGSRPAFPPNSACSINPPGVVSSDVQLFPKNGRR